MAWQHFSDAVFEDHVQVTIEQKPFQSADGIQHLGTAQATDDADIAKLLHGAPAGNLCGDEKHDYGRKPRIDKILSASRRLPVSGYARKMILFPDLLQLPHQLRHPEVRDLAWVILAPPMLAATPWPQRHPLASSDWVSDPARLEQWLRQLDRDSYGLLHWLF